MKDERCLQAYVVLKFIGDTFSLRAQRPLSNHVELLQKSGLLWVVKKNGLHGRHWKTEMKYMGSYQLSGQVYFWEAFHNKARSFVLIMVFLLSPTSECSVTPILSFLLPFLNVYAFLSRGLSRALTLQPFLPPRIPSSTLPPLHLIHSLAAAVICLVPWPTSSHHRHSFFIKFKIVFHSCHFHCCSF